MKKRALYSQSEFQRQLPHRRPCRADGADCIRLCFEDFLGKTYVTYRDHEVTAMKAEIAQRHSGGAVLFSATRGKWFY